MGKIETFDMPPLTDTGGAGRDCPECGHDFGESTTREQSRLAKFLRMKPWPAGCRNVEDDPSGWSAGIGCMCTNPFHGS